MRIALVFLVSCASGSGSAPMESRNQDMMEEEREWVLEESER